MRQNRVHLMPPMSNFYARICVKATPSSNNKDRKAVMAGLKPIYQANTPEEALAALVAFENSSMGKRYPYVAQSWRSAWAQVIPFFHFPRSIRK